MPCIGLVANIAGCWATDLHVSGFWPSKEINPGDRQEMQNSSKFYSLPVRPGKDPSKSISQGVVRYSGTARLISSVGTGCGCLGAGRESASWSCEMKTQLSCKTSFKIAGCKKTTNTARTFPDTSVGKLYPSIFRGTSCTSPISQRHISCETPSPQKKVSCKLWKRSFRARLHSKSLHLPCFSVSVLLSSPPCFSDLILSTLLSSALFFSY